MGIPAFRLRRLGARALASYMLLVAGCGRQKSPPALEPYLTGTEAQSRSVAQDPQIGRPQWPQEPRAPAGAPNVVLILVDDVGFSSTATFGGIIRTPNFDKLAAAGLRYNNFHVNALCSPSRAALLTGRNSHQVGFGTVAEAASGFPGYSSIWPKSTASVAEVLKDTGYSTAAFGKWHNTPTWEVSPAGPFDRWPTGLGFQHFYGFLAGYDNQYYPRLFRDTVPVEPATTPARGYDLTTDITNESIHWLHQVEAVAPDKPFFLYYAPGATHMPHQVPKSWIEKYKGKFDAGWDALREETFARQKRLGILPVNAELTPRPSGLPAWDSLTTAQKKLLAHQMEVYAAFTEQTDYEVGRLLKDIKDSGHDRNTLVIEIFGDNGASAEGGINGYDARNDQGQPLSVDRRLQLSNADGSELNMNHHAAAWAWALSSPFQGTKMDASHLGGTTDPLVIAWPARIKSGGALRTQFQHLIDIAPTIYEAAGITAPRVVNGVDQLPLEGSSLLYTFDHPEEPSHHHIQYFATLGNLGIYKDGWWAGRNAWSPWDVRSSTDARHTAVPGNRPWELYNLKDDYSQAHDLSAKDPEKLKELQGLFDAEARRNQVYPLFQPSGSQPHATTADEVFTYREGVERLPNAIAPQLAGRRYTITADVELAAGNTSGVIVAQGSRYGGFTLFVKNSKVVYEVNAFGNRTGKLVSSSPLRPGKSHIVLDVLPGERPNSSEGERVSPPPQPGSASLVINGVARGSADFTNINGNSYTETLDVGSDLGSAVSSAYESPNRFSGRIDQVVIRIR